MAKLTKQEYKILMEAQIDLTGYDNIKKVIEGTKSSKETIQKLAEFTGMLKGMADTISQISKSGFKADLQSIAKIINQSMETFNSMPDIANIQNVAGPKKYATGRAAKRRFTKDPGQVAAFGAVAQAKMIEVGGVLSEANSKLLLNLQKQLNAEKEKTYKLTRSTVEVERDEIDNTKFFEQDAENKRKEAEERYKERADLFIEEDKAQYAHQKNSALRHQKLWKLSVQDQVKTLKLAKKERERILKDQGDAEYAHHKNSVARTQRIFVSSIHDQVKRLRKQKRDRAKLLKEQDAAEYAAHKESVRKAKQEHDKAEKNRLRSFGNTLKSFFSLERLAARISFVITAKLSYDLFNIISRLPGQMLQTWREFQSEISKTFALLANETKLTKDRLTNDVINLSKTYGIAAKEISTALYEIISAQVGVADASKVLEEAIKLSMAGGGDITTAAHSLVQLMNAYDIAFSQAGRVSDIAFQTVKYGQLTLQQYTDQMSKVVATASILKIPLEEISAAISTMTINGINADQAFTALNQMLMIIANPTEKSKKLLAELGYNLSIGEVQAKGLGGALSELIPMLNMTGSANEELITILFKNRTGFKAVASLLQNMPEYYQNYIRMIDSVGASQEGLAERTNTVDFQMNRLKTTWEALMMSFIQGDNQTVVNFYKSLANNIDKLTKNLHLLFGIVKAIGIAVAGVGLKYLLVSISKLITMIKMIPAQLGLVANAAKVTWASFTGGLSLVITLLAEAMMIIGQFAKKAKDAAIDKALGLDRATTKVQDFESSLSDMDSKIGQLEGIKKFISQWEELNNAQKKNANQKSAIESMYNSIVGVMRNAGIALDSTKTKAENMANAIVLVTNKIRELSAESSRTSGLLKLNEIRQNLSALMKNKPGFLSFPSISKEFAFQVIDDYVKTLNYNMRSMEQTIERGKGMPDESIITQNAATFFIRQIDKQLEKLSIDMARKTVKGRTTGIEYNLGKDYYDTLASLRGELLAAKQALGEITTAKLMSDIEMNIPDTVVDTSTGGGGGKPGVFSMKDQAKQLYESLLGQNIYETTKELQDKLLADINAIKENIEKSKQDGSTQLDEIDTEYYLNIAERMIKGDRYVQLFEEGTNTITKIFENAKRLKDSGLFKEAEAEFNRASEIKDSFEELMKNWGGENQAIISLLDSFPRNRHPVLMYGDDAGKIPAWNTQSAFEKLFKTDYEKIVERGFIGTREQWEELQGMTLSEIEAFKRDIETFEQNTKTAIIQFQSTFMSGAREALSDEDFINLALEHFEINTDVTKNWDELRKAIEEAEKEGFVAKSEFLKFIADNTMTAYKDFLAKMFDLDQPEYVKDAISAIKSKIDNDKIVDKKVIQEMIDKVIEKLLDMGQTVSDKDRDAITKGVMPENAETKGFDWKSAVGIADYENDNEAILDISKQAVSQLQAVWSFYWDWEIKQLQKQHDKKLGLLEDEKNIMLANENMSAQQRAIIEERFEEKKKAMQKKLDKEMAAKKKKQAIFDASIDFARGLIGIWSSELSKGIFGLATAPILTGLLSGIFATQLALINNQKFARGGYTGSGVGSPDETGYRPAGIVHEGELVIDKKTLDRGNLNPLMSIYQAMKSGQSFDTAASNYLMGNLQTKMPRPINNGMFAGGGYVGKNRSVLQNQEITIDFKGMKVLDPVELNRLVIDVGGKKRRKIGE